MQLVWVCLHGTDYGLARHIVLLLRLARMRRVFTLIKVGTTLLTCPFPPPPPPTPVRPRPPCGPNHLYLSSPPLLHPFTVLFSEKSQTSLSYSSLRVACIRAISAQSADVMACCNNCELWTPTQAMLLSTFLLFCKRLCATACIQQEIHFFSQLHALPALHHEIQSMQHLEIILRVSHKVHLASDWIQIPPQTHNFI